MIWRAIRQRVCKHLPLIMAVGAGDTPNDNVFRVRCAKCGRMGTWSMLDYHSGEDPIWGDPEPFIRVGTKSVLFGVHQFLLHPLFVLRAWYIIYGSRPTLAEFCAILTHDAGYWGMPNMDGPEGEEHPEKIARMWRRWFGSFGDKVAAIVLGHSRFHAARNGLPLSRLFRPDKLATALYPKWLYLLLANASGEIHEYIARCQTGKYAEVHHMAEPTQTQWLIEIQAHMALMGLKGEDYHIVKQQMGLSAPEPLVPRTARDNWRYQVAEQANKSSQQRMPDIVRATPYKRRHDDQ